MILNARPVSQTGSIFGIIVTVDHPLGPISEQPDGRVGACELLGSRDEVGEIIVIGDHVLARFTLIDLREQLRGRRRHRSRCSLGMRIMNEPIDPEIESGQLGNRATEGMTGDTKLETGGLDRLLGDLPILGLNPGGIVEVQDPTTGRTLIGNVTGTDRPTEIDRDDLPGEWWG